MGSMMTVNQTFNPMGPQMPDSQASKMITSQLGTPADSPNIKQMLFVGKLYQQANNKWNPIDNAELTAETFLNIKILDITKMKVKAESEINGTKIIKICTAR